MGFLDFLSKPAKPMLGLDISSSAVKLIELSQSADRYKHFVPAWQRHCG
jgi:type IV pilus assembly protein PilM